jgi:restriction endonuclease Mrr
MNFDELRDQVQWLIREDGIAPERTVNQAIGDILQPLLAKENLELRVHKNLQFSEIDYAASNMHDPSRRLSVAIEYKHFRNGISVGSNLVLGLLGTISTGAFDRALFISRAGFTSEAKQVAEQAKISVELLDLHSILTWIDRLEASSAAHGSRTAYLVKTMSHEFARIVAEVPEELNNLEWRDLERMMCRVMEGLGFETTLTPPSKDGGKDLILKCLIKNKAESYIVELKHWRAGKPVVKGAITDFLNVIVSEGRQGGLFLSSSGYAQNVSEGFTKITRQKLKLGDKSKIISLAQTYMKAYSGLWNPSTDLPELLFEGTIEV